MGLDGVWMVADGKLYHAPGVRPSKTHTSHMKMHYRLPDSVITQVEFAGTIKDGKVGPSSLYNNDEFRGYMNRKVLGESSAESCGIAEDSDGESLYSGADTGMRNRLKKQFKNTPCTSRQLQWVEDHWDERIQVNCDDSDSNSPSPEPPDRSYIEPAKDRSRLEQKPKPKSKAKPKPKAKSKAKS
eukprot:CAMPEP_0119312656 /NCGR_PEP_ID=MMETSP1333-20130426/26934_1 /TAXON_ID=418940 /ORGANISM="Scyphosphaera apsteinii, Strain RCC1455" /LENGTH=184 /DNA_ID=CAMNT_0007317309 /DNA_START=42 /DNA_END=596 /DNA_ORIENTATION=+